MLPMGPQNGSLISFCLFVYSYDLLDLCNVLFLVNFDLISISTRALVGSGDIAILHALFYLDPENQKAIFFEAF